MFYFNVFLKADNLISIEIKNVNKPVTINLLKNFPSLAKRGRGDLLASLALRAVAKATFKRKRLWQKLIQPHTQ